MQNNHSNKMLENDGLIPWRADPDTGAFTYVGQQAKKLLGYSLEDWYTPNFWFSALYPDDRESVAKQRAEHISRGDAFAMEYRLLTASGRILWVRDMVTPSRDDGQQMTLHGIMIDISALKETQQQLEWEKQCAQVTLQSIADGVVVFNGAGQIQQMNTVAEQLTGWTNKDATGHYLAEVVEILDEYSKEKISFLATHTFEPIRVENNAVLLSRNGRERAIEVSVSSIRLASGLTIGTVMVLHDVTEQRRLMNAIKHQAMHDPLTGLLNRREFELRLQRTIASVEEHNTEHVLLAMDLDQFKVVNDTCGHAAGDELLRQLALYLSKNTRERDTLARLGGDEFALLMEHCTVTQAMRVANVLLEKVRNFRFFCQSQFFRVGISIGLVPINDGKKSMADVLKLADHACYLAKESGRNCVYAHSDDNTDILQRQLEMSWVKRLNDALHQQRFSLCYQVIRPLGQPEETGEHWEILLRLSEPDGRLLAPSAFLPSAERYDLMPTIDRWVIENTLNWLASHPATCEKLASCSINVSVRTLSDKSFLQYVEELLDKTQVPTKKICFEITETAAISNLQKTLTFINTLKVRGCRFSLDDFGTGMASFSYLKLLPVDFIKIDGSFVGAMTVNDVDFEMVRSIHAISQKMGKKTIAEFVTDKEILDKLTVLGVDYAQGYYLGRPTQLH